MNQLGYKALESIKVGDLEQTNDYIQQFIQQSISENDESSMYELAISFKHLGFIEQAKIISDSGLSTWQEDDWVILLAELHIDTDNLDKALDYLLTIQKTSPLYPTALFMTAEIYQIQELYEVSRQKLLMIKQLLPNEKVIDAALAEVLVLMGEYEAALAIYDTLIDENILLETELTKKTGRLLSLLGRFEESIQRLEELSIEEHDSETLFELGLAYYQIAEYKRAIHWFDLLLVKDPDYLSAQRYLGDSLIEDGQQDRAIEVFEKAIKENPYDSSLYSRLHVIYLKNRQYKQLDKLFQQSMHYIPDDVNMHVLYAYHLLDQELYDDVITFIHEQLSQQQEDIHYYWLLASAYGKLEQDDQAQQYYEQAYTLFKDDTAFLIEYAHYLREIGKHSKRAMILKKLPVDIDIETI